jgi:hypothetical protein
MPKELQKTVRFSGNLHHKSKLVRGLLFSTTNSYNVSFITISVAKADWTSMLVSTYRPYSGAVRSDGEASWRRPTRGVRDCCSGHLQSCSGHWNLDRLEADHPAGDIGRAVPCGAARWSGTWALPPRRGSPLQSADCNSGVSWDFTFYERDLETGLKRNSEGVADEGKCLYRQFSLFRALRLRMEETAPRKGGLLSRTVDKGWSSRLRVGKELTTSHRKTFRKMSLLSGIEVFRDIISVADFCEHGNEHSSSVKAGDFLTGRNYP